MEKAHQVKRRGLVMVKAVVKVKAKHRARASVRARAARKVPASKALRTPRFQPFHFHALQRAKGQLGYTCGALDPSALSLELFYFFL